jgi:hypothetical protein
VVSHRGGSKEAVSHCLVSTRALAQWGMLLREHPRWTPILPHCHYVGGGIAGDPEILGPLSGLVVRHCPFAKMLENSEPHGIPMSPASPSMGPPFAMLPQTQNLTESRFVQHKMHGSPA